ncbi:DUF2313 domain-containing protein [Salmonella enterica subsp. enterica serovar Alachua]|nr:DUF2313 domain-containing protein [Salmonella enterica subsp. enterica serovar Alachua]
MTSRYSSNNYATAMQALLPTGRIWPRHPDSTQSKVIAALAKTYQRSDASAVALLAGAFPATALTMLYEWEETMGLPDNCSISEVQTIQQRRNAVVARLVGEGNLSKNYYIEVAAALGYDITITEFRQARCGFSVCGEALNGEDWPYTWKINAGETTYVQAQCGQTFCSEPLSTWGNKILECTMNAIAPPFTILLFSYT